MTEIINISLCKSDNLEAFKLYNKGYAKIIQELGTDYSKFLEDWYLRPNTYFCVFSDEKNEPIGGFRLQLHQTNYSLPIQEKTIKYSDKIDSFIEERNYFELCEGNGFYVVSAYRKTIISYEILRSLFVPIILLDLKTMVGIALEQTSKILANLGIVTSKKIMFPDEYFSFANTKGFVFELYNLSDQVAESLKTRKDAYILKGMLNNKKYTYRLKSRETEYEFRFENLID